MPWSVCLLLPTLPQHLATQLSSNHHDSTRLLVACNSTLISSSETAKAPVFKATSNPVACRRHVYRSQEASHA